MTEHTEQALDMMEPVTETQEIPESDTTTESTDTSPENTLPVEDSKTKFLDKTFQIKTNLCTGILMSAFSGYMLMVLPEQVREPAYNSGAPSPRIIPSVALWGILFCAVCLIGQSVILKKEKIVPFQLARELPAIILIGMLCLFSFLILQVGFLAAVVLIFPPMLFYMGERKPFIYIFTLTAGVGVYFLFREVLNISLPAFSGFGG